MVIRKFLHSCILIESKGQKLLIDPGLFSFIEGKLKPEDIPTPDVLLITHEHPDHYFPEAIAKIIKPTTKIIAHERIVALLKDQKIEATALSPDTTTTVGVFKITGIRAPHGELPVPAPYAMGYFINGKILHPGDSLRFTPQAGEILCLPVAAPWMTLKEATDLVLAMKPKTVIPVHDGFVKDFLRIRIYDMIKRALEGSGISLEPLELGESLEIPD